MSDALRIERSASVLTLWLNRPTLHNAFDASLIAQLTAALEAAGRDDHVRAVVLAGEGASFSAGADMQWMRGMAAASEEDNRQDSLALARLMRTLDELPKPTIARVQGAAFGGGVGLARPSPSSPRGWARATITSARSPSMASRCSAPSCATTRSWPAASCASRSRPRRTRLGRGRAPSSRTRCPTDGLANPPSGQNGIYVQFGQKGYSGHIPSWSVP